MIGLAFGTIYYPLFLLPLWISFYWQRGLWRFLIGMLAMIALLVITLAFTSIDLTMFLARLQQMFGSASSFLSARICAACGNSGTNSTATRSWPRSSG